MSPKELSLTTSITDVITRSPSGLKRYVRFGSILILFARFALAASAGTLLVDLDSTNPVPPYAEWTTAATNIQDAIDAASDGDTVLVTNGTYAVGGKVMYGDLTNRVALDKAVTVQSVNGPDLTTIQGAYDSSSGNGPLAVRCAWLTNGASLVGFTLLGGATRSSGDQTNLLNGGGVWCASSNASVANCVVISNKAMYYGGGAYQGNFSNCLFTGNSAFNGGGACGALLNLCRAITNTASSSGGAAYGGTLRTCLVTSNSATTGGAVYIATLYNCTVTRNSAKGTMPPISASALTNCIVYFNTPANYFSCTMAYSCSTPLPPGTGNIALDPQFLGDGIHLASTSPCRGAGTNVLAGGTDIDGQPWADPPSMGCDDWQPAPVIALQPRFQINPSGTGFAISISPAGMGPFDCWWSRNGVPIEDGTPYNSAQTTNLLCGSVGELVGSSYQVVVSNAFGMITSVVAQAAVHCVDARSTSPVAPYSTWTSAATAIQDAIATAQAGEWVLVTNGLYATGGKSMDGVITNRVTLDKSVTVQSVNGPGATFIEGNGGTNGPAAVRCAWLTNGAILGGFTLCGGATRAIDNPPNDSMIGGGVWASSTGATVLNCVIATNLAAYEGGGAYKAGLYDCTLIGNHAVGSGRAGVGIGGAGTGGGAYGCNLTNCIITCNFADQMDGGGTTSCNLYGCALTKNSTYMSGGGAYRGTLLNCTISGNISAGYGGYGGAVAGATLINCVSYANVIRGNSFPQTNFYNCTMAYCDSDPLPAGSGNIDADPQWLPDGFHVMASSPCRGAGTNPVVGTDIDGQAWANPPAIGCDEWQPAAVVLVQPQVLVIVGNRALSLYGAAGGQEPFAWSWIKDGALIQDSTHYSGSGSSNLVVNRFDASDAGGYQLIVSNAFGMATSQVAQVVIHCADAASSNPVPPYSTWSAAAATIQDAIDAAGSGDIVLVTNGLYATGGRLIYTDVSNRVVLDKALTVMSMNGYPGTIIQGAWDPATNGPAAMRCAWLTNGATLAGFTLQGGATRAYPAGLYAYDSFSGGAVWCSSAAAVVANCLIRSNTASYWGGAIYQGTINDCAINNNAMLPGSLFVGGTIYSASVNNCTVTRNSVLGSYGYGGGLYLGAAKNSIIWGNSSQYYPNCYSVAATYCDTSPAISGAGNISSDPLFVDAVHILPASPCCGAGKSAYATGFDIDAEAWNSPPSVGCDEPVASGLVGPLSVSFVFANTNLYVNRSYGLAGQVTGRVSWLMWDFGDGTILTNVGYSVSHKWTMPGVHKLALTAYNSDYPEGVSGTVQLDLLPMEQPALTAGGMMTNGFQVQLVAQSNLIYVVQRATNLAPPVSWQTVQVGSTNADGILQVLDPAATGNAQFYRVQVQ
jgi:Immunoglobulin I-set domain/PKD domain